MTGDIAMLAQDRTVAVAGAGVTGFDAPGVLTLTGDPIAEAERLTAPR
jgi:hypothetical protein